jgi:hypothetical protein
VAGIKENAFVAYGTLAGACLVALVTYLDYETGRRLATDPRARPEAFTASDGEHLRKECEERARSIERQFKRELDQLHRKIAEQDAKIFHLYEQEYNRD